MVWIQRRSDIMDYTFQAPSYENSDLLFTIRMHYSGSFSVCGQLKYMPDRISYFDYCNVTELTLKNLHEMVTLLGEESWVRFYCSLVGLHDCDHLILISNDSDAKNLITYCSDERVVDVYVEKIETVDQGNTEVEDSDMEGSDHVKDIEIMEVDNDSDSNEEDSDDDDSQFTDDFEDSEFEYDDVLFDDNIDEDVEWVGYNVSKDGKVDQPTKVLQYPKLIKGKNCKTSHYQVYQGDANSSNFDFEVGMCFNTAGEFRDAVRTYSNMQGRPMKFTKNYSDKIQITCDCGWVMYASFISKEDKSFQIKSIKGEHTCYRTSSSKHCTSNLLAKKYQHHLRSNPDWPVTSMQEVLQMENKSSLSVWKIYRVKKHADKLNHGTEMEQYAKLWDYCDEIRRTNPDTTIKVKCKHVLDAPTCIFKKLYISWGALKKGFIAGCRPVIGLDGTHLKTSHGGVLLCAVGIDANNGMFPFAYAIVLKENRNSWEWFLSLLIQDLNIENSYLWTIISDKQKGLLRAVEELLPNAEHRFCLRHMYNNFKLKHKGMHLKSLIWKAASATRVVDFKCEIEIMKAQDSAAHNWIIQRRSKLPVKKKFTKTSGGQDMISQEVLSGSSMPQNASTNSAR